MKKSPDFQPTVRRLQPEFAKILEAPKFFVAGDVFSYPNWSGIDKVIQNTLSSLEQADAYDVVALAWLENLCTELGGGYRVHEYEKIWLVSNLEEAAVRSALLFLARATASIREMLGSCAWRNSVGYEIVMLFDDEDDYYDYIAHYYPDGVHTSSSGVFVHSSYTHIAVPLTTCLLPRVALGHELAHSALSSYRLPIWLNEGIAVTCETAFAGDFQPPSLNRELVSRHYEHWNAANIQRFWSGVSFRTPGEEVELSYSLSGVLFQWLLEKKNALPGFIAHADPMDAGQTAALDHLGLCLGEVAAQFLGEGDWRPRRKEMMRLWKPDREDEHADSSS
ncbi:MAG: hypothetical protein K0Q55_874 [Verrucomicrobia bacterium]|jgi:hypothetical protein|nr:hypothetical protein [Verrucomicrobiota bacterium]